MLDGQLDEHRRDRREDHRSDRRDQVPVTLLPAERHEQRREPGHQHEQLQVVHRLLNEKDETSPQPDSRPPCEGLA